MCIRIPHFSRQNRFLNLLPILNSVLDFEDWATSFASYLSKQKIQSISLQKLLLYPVLHY